MLEVLRLCAGILARLVRSRRNRLIENLALRQQLGVFKRRKARPRLVVIDKLFWLFLRRFWSSWRSSLIVVSPDTVVRWHRAGFQLYWRLISRVWKPIGRRPVTKEIRELIFKMAGENPTWGAPRIHGELLMLFAKGARRRRWWLPRWWPSLINRSYKTFNAVIRGGVDLLRSSQLQYSKTNLDF
jgi:putative transposase